MVPPNNALVPTALKARYGGVCRQKWANLNRAHKDNVNSTYSSLQQFTTMSWGLGGSKIKNLYNTPASHLHIPKKHIPFCCLGSQSGLEPYYFELATYRFAHFLPTDSRYLVNFWPEGHRFRSIPAKCHWARHWTQNPLNSALPLSEWEGLCLCLAERMLIRGRRTQKYFLMWF